MTNFLEQDTSPKATSIVSLVALLAFFPLLLMGVYNAAIIVTRAFGVKANIVVNTQNVLEPIRTDFYHAFAQGGEEASDMIGPVLNEVRALNPQVIRIDHIYDHYNVVSRSGSDLTFDFSRLDQAVDSIIDAGATPMLVLSFMPRAIARDEVIINPPNNWEDWALVVQRTIEHYSGKDQKNLQNIYYEVWNEPDLEIFGKWHYASEDKNYLTLYRYSALGANRAQNVNAFSLGGPSTTGLYKNWILALVRSGQRLDFFSWHSYQNDPTRFNQDQRDLVSWLLPYPGYTLLPKMITEYGFTGAKDGRYNTTYAAAHTAATIRQLISGQPTYMFAFELKDGPGQSNGWGLIGHENDGKTIKPRYHVFSFIDSMIGNRLELSGEGSWVTGFATKRDETIRVLLVNFDNNGSHTENVPITINGLEPGNYTYRERFLLGRDVVFDETITNQKPTITRDVFMPAQSVAILEITKK